MKHIFEGTALFVVALFGLFGAIALGILVHEYSHARDFAPVATNEDICALSIPTQPSKLLTTGLAYYSFEIKDESNPNVLKKVEDISKYTEYKAYSLTFVTLLIFLTCLEVVFRRTKIGLKNS